MCVSTTHTATISRTLDVPIAIKAAPVSSCKQRAIKPSLKLTWKWYRQIAAVVSLFGVLLTTTAGTINTKVMVYQCPTGPCFGTTACSPSPRLMGYFKRCKVTKLYKLSRRKGASAPFFLFPAALT
jgi:hypothetical protein